MHGRDRTIAPVKRGWLSVPTVLLLATATWWRVEQQRKKIVVPELPKFVYAPMPIATEAMPVPSSSLPMPTDAPPPGPTSVRAEIHDSLEFRWAGRTACRRPRGRSEEPSRRRCAREPRASEQGVGRRSRRTRGALTRGADDRRCERIEPKTLVNALAVDEERGRAVYAAAHARAEVRTDPR